MNPYYVNSAEIVNNVGDADKRKSKRVVVVIPELERPQDNGLDSDGYLKMYHVPSTEDVSKIDNHVSARKSDVADELGLDRNGYLLPHHVKNAGEVDEIKEDVSIQPSVGVAVSPEANTGDRMTRNTCTQLDHATSAGNVCDVNSTGSNDCLSQSAADDVTTVELTGASSNED